MRTRKRKPRVVWLPPDPNNRLGAAPGSEITSTSSAIQGFRELQLSTGPRGTFDGYVVPVVGDKTNAGAYIIGASAQDHTFDDLFTNGYRLRRICGHIWPRMVQRGEAGDGKGINYVVTVGFQVMEVNEGGAPANGEEAVLDSYATQENPWIWRRSWILTNFVTAGASGQTWGTFGPAQGGFSVREGSIIDQKTARRIGPDQRLFMAVQATSLEEVTDGQGFIEVCWNYRVLASLLTVPAGNRRNSSR